MRQIDGVIFEAIYYDVICTSSARCTRIVRSTYEADAVIIAIAIIVFITKNRTAVNENSAQRL